MTLQCDAVAVPTPVYYEIFYDNELVHNSTTGTFTIAPAMHYHEGIYVCSPFNAIGRGVNASTFLDVKGTCIS